MCDVIYIFKSLVFFCDTDDQCYDAKPFLSSPALSSDKLNYNLK